MLELEKTQTPTNSINSDDPLNRTTRSVSFEAVHAKFGGEGSKIAIIIIWIAAALSLTVSLWVTVPEDETGEIYLRATEILYLTLSVSVEGNVIRSVRSAGASVILMLALNGLSQNVLNTPLFIATALCLLHMVASVLTYPSGKMIGISGLRGLSFVLLGVGTSAVFVLVSLYSHLQTWSIEQSIAFGTAGLPIIVLANGIPKISSTQVIACFAVLAPTAAGMYCLSALTLPAPWILAVTGVTVAFVSALLCLTSHRTWKETMRGMIYFIQSPKVAALLVLMLSAFGNIATINGYIALSEKSTCLMDGVYARGTACSNAFCITDAEHVESSKFSEELIPLLLLGLAKGAVMSVIVLGPSSDKEESNAWAAASFLTLSAIIWLSVEGRARCFTENSNVCDPYRSDGFIAGICICGVSALVCLVRTVYSGYIMQWIETKQLNRLKASMNKNLEQGSCLSRYKVTIMKRLKDRETVMAVATTALLVCLIASSTSYITVSGDVDKCSLSQQFNCSLDMEECMFERTVVYEKTLNLTVVPLLQERILSLEAYWQHTAWIVSGSTAALALLAVESMPKNPSVAIALSTGLLVAAALVHYSCLMSHLNSRLSAIAMRMSYRITLNVYIVSIISVIIGLAWGSAVSRNYESKKKSHKENDREEKVETNLVYVSEACMTGYDRTTEMRDLRVAGFLELFIRSQYISKPEGSEVVRDSDYFWDIKGNNDLQEGCYEFPWDASSLARCARCSYHDYGYFRAKEHGDEPVLLC